MEEISREVAPTSTPSVEKQLSELPKSGRSLPRPLLFLFLGLLLGAAVTFAALKLAPVQQVIPWGSQPTPTPTVLPTVEPVVTPIIEGEKWIKSTILGRGLVFEYPEGWHVAFDNFADVLYEQYRDYGILYINSKPIEISTTHGPICDILLFIKNGLADPEGEFNSQLEKEKMDLLDFKDDLIPSQYFGNIHHITGKTKSTEAFESQEMEKYLFISPHEEPQNRTIAIVKLNGPKEKSPILKKIVSSFKECHRVECESILME